ncbi:hypothetical protein P4133_05055 [Pseudomonas aeruginosa]|nr:hypothetical protein [Pseudomonas aeruginosa]
MAAGAGFTTTNGTSGIKSRFEKLDGAIFAEDARIARRSSTTTACRAEEALHSPPTRTSAHLLLRRSGRLLNNQYGSKDSHARRSTSIE